LGAAIGSIGTPCACINKLQNQNRRQQTRIAVLEAKIENAHAARRSDDRLDIPASLRRPAP
jgi:hypothetical protein